MKGKGLLAYLSLRLYRKSRCKFHYLSFFNIFVFICCLGFTSCPKKNPVEPVDEKNSWISINSGLSDLRIQSICLTSKAKYVSTNNGIFKSSYNTSNWQLANAGMTSNDVKVIIAKPANIDQLFAGTWGDGIFVSFDAAATWQPINNGITDLRIWSITMNPGQPEQLDAVSETEILLTIDGGMSWESLKGPAGEFRSIATDFNNGSVFAGTAYHDIYRKKNNSNTLESINNNLPQANAGNFYTVKSMRLLHDVTNIIWAAISSKGLYYSRDEGENWNSINNDLSGVTIQCMVIANDNPNFIVISTTQGVFITKDNAQSWTKMNDGLTNLDVRAIAIDPQDSNIIYAGTMGGGVFKMILE